MIDVNTTHIVLLESPRDVQQIDLIDLKLYKTQFSKESYKSATNQPFGHLLNDLDRKSVRSITRLF